MNLTKAILLVFPLKNVLTVLMIKQFNMNNLLKRKKNAVAKKLRTFKNIENS